jgi:very-short-patch-repair endonuclease
VKHEFARTLRREQTDVERKLWFVLRGRQFAGFKFRRQQPIGPYIADFVCFETKLIIELDGDQHGSDQGIAYDNARTRFLKKEGFRVLRFPNQEIHRYLDTVRDAIADHCGTDPSPAAFLRNAAPSPTRGEG